MNRSDPIRLTRRQSGVAAVAGVLVLLALLPKAGSADTPNPPTISKASVVGASPAQNDVTAPGPLTGLTSGSVIRVTVTAKPGNEGKFFGGNMRLCKSGVDIKNQANFNPTQFGNCIDKPFSDGTDDYVELDAKPASTTATADFRVGTGTDAFTSSLNGDTSIMCGVGNPCTLWLKESFDTSLAASGVAWIHFDLQFGSNGPASTTTTTTIGSGTTTTTSGSGTTTTTSGGATTTTTAGSGTTTTTSGSGTTTTTSGSGTTTTTSGSGTTTTTSGSATTTTTTVAAFTVSPSSVVPGGSVTVSSPGWQPGATVKAVLNSDPMDLGEATASDAGSVDTSFTVPDSAPAGNHRLSLSGIAADGTARALDVALVVTVADSTTTTSPLATATLFRTGADVLHDLWSGGGLIVAGILLVITVRRRERLGSG